MMSRLGFCTLMLAMAVTASAVAQGQRAAPAPSSRAAPAQGQRPGAAASVVTNPNQDQPIQIESATLEVRDKNKMATFTGDVVVVQGDITLKCKVLVVFYGQEVGLNGAGAPTPAKQTSGLPQDAQSIRRIEARGDVTVISKDQNASGDFGVYDPKAKTITLTGNVVVTQGQDVIRGERVVVNTATGNAHFESGGNATNGSTTPGRVRALIVPHSGQSGGSGNMLQFGPSKTN